MLVQSKQLKPAVLKMFTDVTESSKNLPACFFFSHTRDKTIKNLFHFITEPKIYFFFFFDKHAKLFFSWQLDTLLSC